MLIYNYWYRRWCKMKSRRWPYYDWCTVVLICSLLLICIYVFFFKRTHALFEVNKTDALFEVNKSDVKHEVNPWYNTRNDMILTDTIPHNIKKVKRILWVNPPQWEIENLKSSTLLSGCQIKMCTVHVLEGQYDHNDFTQMDALVYSAVTRYSFPEPVYPRPTNQVWALFTMESPYLSFLRTWSREEWDNQINLTMTYRLDSDIVVNYGITRKKKNLPANHDFHTIISRKTKLVAFVVSHCHTPSARETYIKKLSKYIDVDIYGRCGIQSNDPNLFDTIERDYKFYLSFENAFCKDYVTEKFFDIQRRNIISVVRGGAVYSNFYPENTYINVNDFDSVKSLASYLHFVANNPSQYVEYLKQKDKFEHTPGNVYIAMCDLCKLLHSPNRKPKVYTNLYNWFTKNMCWAPTDIDN